MTQTPCMDQLAAFFTPTTMSVHIKPGQPLMRKEGAPGNWSITTDSNSLSGSEIMQLVTKIQQDTNSPSAADIPAFSEISRKYSQVIQYGTYRIVFTQPPVSSVPELTIVRPVKKLALTAYDLDPEIVKIITNPHHGILIAGSPGEGKSTFAQAVIAELVQQNLIIKTIEAPRDLQVDPRITQLSFFHAAHSEIKDILLLSRPDVTIFDEVRNNDDFHLYKDLRLAGIGMIGVMHATEPIDALQRFLHAVDLGSAAHVISYIVFIKAGGVKQILQLNQTVKVPAGMLAEDLARPVIEVTDLITGEVTHEVYSYGEQVVVMPLGLLPTAQQKPPVLAFATQGLKEKLSEWRGCPVQVEINSATSITVKIPDAAKGEIIGRQGATIKKRESKLGCQIHIETLETDHDTRGGPPRHPRKHKKKRK